jgi:hypothetical protein
MPGASLARRCRQSNAEPPKPLEPFRNRLQELAADVGRLQRQLPADSSAKHTAERIAGHTYTLIEMLEPTAAQIAAYYAPGDAETASEAIRLVDVRVARLRHTLGMNAP